MDKTHNLKYFIFVHLANQRHTRKQFKGFKSITYSLMRKTDYTRNKYMKQALPLLPS